MGSTLESSGMGGQGHPNIRELLSVSGSGGVVIWIGYMGDVSTHWEYVGRIAPLNDTPTGQGSRQYIRRTGFSLTPTVNGDEKGWLGGGRDIHCPLLEHRCAVHHE